MFLCDSLIPFLSSRGWGGTLYRYRTEAAQEAIREYSKIAKANGMSLTELALRWNRQRSLVTTTLVGHTSMKQLKETLQYFGKKEPLPDQVMWDIDVIHMRNRLPIFSNSAVGRDWSGEGIIGEPTVSITHFHDFDGRLHDMPNDDYCTAHDK